MLSTTSSVPPRVANKIPLDLWHGVVVDPPCFDDLPRFARLLNMCSLRHSSRSRPLMGRRPLHPASVCPSGLNVGPLRQEPSKMHNWVIGFDIAKQVFQVHAAGAEGRMVAQARLRRGQVLDYFHDLPPCLVGGGVRNRPPLGA